MNIPAAVALALLLGSGAAWAREQKRLPHPGASRHREGIVLSVDAAAGRLSLKDEDGRVRRFRAGKARVEAVEGKVLSLADLAVGDSIAVSYNRTIRGKDVIEVLRLKPAARR